MLSALEKIQLCIDMFRLKKAKWYFAGISAAVSFVCAFIILKVPFLSTEILWIFTGVSLIFEGVFDLSTMLINHKSGIQVSDDMPEDNISVENCEIALQESNEQSVEEEQICNEIESIEEIDFE